MHMQVLKVDPEITIMYKIIITVLLKYILFLIAPHFCILNKHHCCRVIFFFFGFYFFGLHRKRGPSVLSPTCGPLTVCLGSTLSFTFRSITGFMSCDPCPTRATSIFLGNTYIHGKTCSLPHIFKTCMWQVRDSLFSLDSCAEPVLPCQVIVMYFRHMLFSQGSTPDRLRIQTSGWDPQSQ